MHACPTCGYDNVPGTLFCEECGTALAATAISAPQVATDAPAASAADASAAINGNSMSVASPAGREAAGLHSPSPDATPAAAAYLVTETGRHLNVPAQGVVIVGREDMRSGIRPDVDLTLDNASAAGVSRRHCRLLLQPGGWCVEDLMSTNYTVLNGRALPAHTPAPLCDGDELRLGKLRMRFHVA